MLREFLDNEATGGIVLMATAAAAIIVANSAVSDIYFGALRLYIGPLNILHWINDALMALFFLLVGLEIKREVLQGQLSRWSRRILPGVGAVGGMVVPAVIYVALNLDRPENLPGWAIPTATDIAFALGVLSLLGQRIPTSLKVFLTALAIIDDLGAILIIAAFYSENLSILDLMAAAGLLAVLIGLNRAKVGVLWPYLLIGAALWIFVLRSGVHATIAGVLLALTIPCGPAPAEADRAEHSPLHRLEHAIQPWVTFLVIPLFGFANAGVRLTGLEPALLTDGLPLGIALGLLVGKAIGVFGFVMIALRLGLADMPMGAGRLQLFGIALLCGIGFTMSLFIGTLAFDEDPAFEQKVKIGILAGSIVSGIAGYIILHFAPRQIPPPGTPRDAVSPAATRISR